MFAEERYFNDRIDAGEQLATRLAAYADRDDVIVMGLPRGGVPVAFEIAKALKLPLDVFLVRKIGVPWQPELAMGAIALRGVQIFNEDVMKELEVPQEAIDAVIAREQVVLEKRNKLYREGREFPDLKNKIIILVDDGVATGATIRAAITALKKLNCKKLVVAVPVAPKDIIKKLKTEVNELICISTPEMFFAIGNWYHDFSRTEDEEVIALLERAKETIKKK